MRLTRSWLQKFGRQAESGLRAMMTSKLSMSRLASDVIEKAKSVGRCDANGLLLDLTSPSETLVISCSGIVPGKVFYAMENTSRSMQTQKLFICDARNLWYYNGIEGSTNSFDQTVELVGCIVEQLQPRSVCTVGTSAGGYMALALAARLNLARALAFGPQTTLGAAWRTAHGDTRWAEEITQIHRIAGPEPYDIVSLLNENEGRSEFHLIYPADDEMDRLHAERVQDGIATYIYRLEGASHNVSAELDNRKKLYELLDLFIQGGAGQINELIASLLSTKAVESTVLKGERLVFPFGLIPWSSSDIAVEQNSVDYYAKDPSYGTSTVEYQLASARLLAVRGELEKSQLLSKKLANEISLRASRGSVNFRDFICLGLLTNLTEEPTALLSREVPALGKVKFEFDVDATSPEIVHWDIEGRGRQTFRLSPGVLTRYGMTAVVRLISIFPLLADFVTTDSTAQGRVLIDTSDVGSSTALSFCVAGTGEFLIPDPVFMEQDGYSAVHDQYAAHAEPWVERKPVAFWRGPSTGLLRGSWRDLQRVRLCEIGRSEPARHLMDVGISEIAQISDPTEVDEMRASGLMRPGGHAFDFIRYRYLIEIDGDAGSWSTLFQKLATGSPVLKIESEQNLRQWYHERLEPWVNFVPVSADMSDLVALICWLVDHEDRALEIGQNGRKLALSMTVENELSYSRRAISAFLNKSQIQAQAV